MDPINLFLLIVIAVSAILMIVSYYLDKRYGRIILKISSLVLNEMVKIKNKPISGLLKKKLIIKFIEALLSKYINTILKTNLSLLGFVLKIYNKYLG